MTERFSKKHGTGTRNSCPTRPIHRRKATSLCSRTWRRKIPRPGRPTSKTTSTHALSRSWKILGLLRGCRGNRTSEFGRHRFQSFQRFQPFQSWGGCIRILLERLKLLNNWNSFKFYPAPLAALDASARYRSLASTTATFHRAVFPAPRSSLLVRERDRRES